MLLKRFCFLVKEGLRKIDLFPTNQFIKYKKQSEFTTATGGFVSLGLITIILILFSSKGIQTMNRSVITSTVTTQIDTDPTPITVVTSPEGGFMFAIGIFGINLNDPLRTFFNISLFQNFYGPLWQPINRTQVPLIECTEDHFNFGQGLEGAYQKFNLRGALCPPLDFAFQIGGRMTSSIFAQFTINLQKCNPNITSNCVSDAVISSFSSFTLSVPIINKIVNPNDPDYMKTYLEDRNFFTFTPAYGFAADAEISEVKINTDLSILPYSDTITDDVIAIPSLFVSRGGPSINNFYGSVSFSKSGTTLIYTRSFSKLDDYFSYIGGLIGSALILFFILKSYSERSYLLDFASNILLTEGSQFSLRKFNFLDNIGIIAQYILGVFKIEMDWKKGIFFIKSLQEMEEQLDICLLVQKISFLEQAVSAILSEHQLDTLYLNNKRSLQVIEKWREKHKIAHVIEDIHERTDLSMKSQDLIGSDSYQPHPQGKQLLDKMKLNVEKVVYQSRHADLISRRIIQKIDPDTLQKLGINQLRNNRSAQLRSRDSVQEIISPERQDHDINAVFNEIEEERKGEIQQKQEFVFEYNDS